MSSRLELVQFESAEDTDPRQQRLDAGSYGDS